jgi:cytochrome c553
MSAPKYNRHSSIEEFSLKLKTGVRGATFFIAFGMLMIATEVAQAPVGGRAAASGGALPLWAYPASPVVATDAAAVDGPVEHVPGSSAGYTKAQIADMFAVPDWFPEAHPAMPGVVAEGRKPEVYACGHCHLANGLGRPENQSVAGLPVAYVEEQLADFKSDLRRSSQPGMVPVEHMIQVAKAATPEEIRAAAEYFSSLKAQKWIRVVETDTVPVTRPVGGMLVVASPAATEPIGERVIEVSEDFEQTELRNPASGFVAYVPKGSLKVGEALVRTGGGGRMLPCALCHGKDLKGQYVKGTGDVPSIAGRSPSQMARQLMDFRSGARHGANSALMGFMAKKLTDADIVAITGYLASLNP